MSDNNLAADHQDALQEITNVAMGQAGAALAAILDSFITLSVPRIRLIDVSHLVATVGEMVDNPAEVTAVRQAFFFNRLRGEALIIYGRGGCSELADLMGYEAGSGAPSEHELLLDVSNVLTGACLNGIGEQIGTDFSYTPPSIMAERVGLDRLLVPQQLPWQQALLVEVNFSLENRNFKSHLLMLMAEDAIEDLRQRLDQLLGRL